MSNTEKITLEQLRAECAELHKHPKLQVYMTDVWIRLAHLRDVTFDDYESSYVWWVMETLMTAYGPEVYRNPYEFGFLISMHNINYGNLNSTGWLDFTDVEVLLIDDLLNGAAVHAINHGTQFGDRIMREFDADRLHAILVKLARVGVLEFKPGTNAEEELLETLRFRPDVALALLVEKQTLTQLNDENP